MYKTITYNFDVLDTKYSVAIRDSSKKLFKHYIPQEEGTDKQIDVQHGLLGFWAFLGTMTMKKLSETDIDMHILPLERVGAAQGASGSRVLVAYFSFKEGDETHYSNSLILKFRDLDLGERDWLIEEMNQAISLMPYVKDRGTYFAFPVVHDIVNNISILWAPFSSSVFDHGDEDGAKPILKEDNLWKAFDKLDLECKDKDFNKIIEKNIDRIYDVMLPVHTKNKQPERIKKNLKCEYKRYLRGEQWRKSFESVWGDSSQKDTDCYGRQWINPLYVYDRLVDYAGSITLGCIHGDLHTKNIVFIEGHSIRLIDFGWSQKDVHIAKDFILLESNLRFMILHPSVPFDDLMLLCDTLGEINDQSIPNYKCEYTRLIHQLIFQVRQKAKRVLSYDNIYEEYLIPLFFLCLGLLNFAKSFNNVTNAYLTVLKLANLIEEHLNKRTS